MAHSYRTARVKDQALANLARDKAGVSLLPRIVVHPPRRGDIHQLDKRLLTALWRWLPVAYRHGISAIELRGRTNEFVGRPFASYHVPSKTISIYSCPPIDWPVAASDPEAFDTYTSFGANVKVHDGGQSICWESKVDAARYMFGFVLMHELGHHYMHQYKHKRKLPTLPGAEEAWATRHGLRLRAWRAYNTVVRRLANGALPARAG